MNIKTDVDKRIKGINLIKKIDANVWIDKGTKINNSNIKIDIDLKIHKISKADNLDIGIYINVGLDNLYIVASNKVYVISFFFLYYIFFYLLLLLN